MAGLKKTDPAFAFSGARITPDEIDSYSQYVVLNPSISSTYVGTCAGGTATVASALVITNGYLDYPRNLLYSAVGTNDFGGTWTINGYDQFGASITETVTNGTVAAGTPAFAVAGTSIFARVSSGTFTATSTSVGIGSARLGVAIGTAGTLRYWLGLPDKIAAVTDVKTITWSTQHVHTAINGGSIQSSTFVNTTNSGVGGSAIMAGTETFAVLYRSTKDLSGAANQASL